jgi:hypothetical protein
MCRSRKLNNDQGVGVWKEIRVHPALCSTNASTVDHEDIELFCEKSQTFMKRRYSRGQEFAEVADANILDVWGISGLLEIVYSFLMHNIDRDSWPGSKPNTATYLQFRGVCKLCHQWSARLNPYLRPVVTSDESMSYWFINFPTLRNVELWPGCTPIWFTNLRSLSFYQTNRTPDLDSNDVKSWNCPLLEHLDLHSIYITESGLQAVRETFPRLQSLAINLHREVNFEVSGFVHLLDLRVGFKHCQRMRLRITNMPFLVAIVSGGRKHQSLEFEGVPNLQTFSSVDGDHEFKELIFHDAVPTLTSVDLGHINFDLVVCDPHHQVIWNKIKTLEFPSVDCCVDISRQLEDIEELQINFQDDERQDIRWSRFQKLKKLDIAWPNSQLISNIACLHASLTELNLHWSSPFALDFKHLIPLRSISYIWLASDYDAEYENFDMICLLPSLQELHVMMKTITTDEIQALQKWETIDCCEYSRSRRAQKDVTYYHRCVIK